MFPEFKNSFPKNHFGIFIYILSWKHFFEIYFRLLRRNNELNINNFLTNIWRDNWNFIIWHRKRTPLWILSVNLYLLAQRKTLLGEAQLAKKFSRSNDETFSHLQMGISCHCHDRRNSQHCKYISEGYKYSIGILPIYQQIL